MRKRKKTWFDYFNNVILSLLVFSTFFPFLYMLNISFSANEFVVRNEVVWWPKGFTLESYKHILMDERILTGYKNTVIYVVLGTFISLVFTSMGAYSLSRKGFILRKFWTVMIVFTMLFNGGMIPTFLVVRTFGIMDTIWAMVLPAAVSVWNLLIMRTFFSNLPEELVDSGKIDGLTDFGVFFRIILPLSKAVLSAIGLFYAVSIWNNFMHALLYLRDDDLYPLQVVVRDMVMSTEMLGSDIGSDSEAVVEKTLKMTTVIVTTLPILLVYPFIQKYFVKGVMIGSVKG